MHWLSRNRRLVVAGICAICAGAIVAVHFFNDFPFVSAIWRQEQNYQNFLQREGRKTATRPDFVFLAIDQSTLDLPQLSPEELENNRALQLMSERPFPWSREVWALLLDRLVAAGARLVLLDLVFDKSGEGDPRLRDALERHRDRVVVGANIEATEARQIIVPNSDLIPSPQLADDRVGFVNFWPDSMDEIVRGVRFTTSSRELIEQQPFPGEPVYESFSARALEKLGYSAAVRRDGQLHPIRFSDAAAYPPRPLFEVFDPKLWQAN